MTRSCHVDPLTAAARACRVPVGAEGRVVVGLFRGLVLQPIDKLDHLLEPHPAATLQRGLEVHRSRMARARSDGSHSWKMSSSTTGGRTP